MSKQHSKAPFPASKRRVDQSALGHSNAIGWEVITPASDDLTELDTETLDQSVEVDADRMALEWRSLDPLSYDDANNAKNNIEDYTECLVYYQDPQGGGDELWPSNSKDIELIRYHLAQAEMLAASHRPRMLKPIKMLQAELADDQPKQPRKSRNKRPPLDLSKIELPPGLKWPSDTYAEAAANGENVVQYLERAWKDLIDAGIATRHVVESHDSTTITGIDNYTRRQPGKKQRIIPSHLRPLTETEINTRTIKADPAVVTRDRRLAIVNARRLSRHKNSAG